MTIVGIAGGTASGKTTLARALVERLEGAALLSHDRYYRDVPDPRRFNYDHPDALDTARLIGDLDALRSRGEAALPVYDFASHRRKRETERLAAPRVLVVEGILALADERLLERFDLALYVDAPDDLRLCRRLLRDMAERGRSAVSVIEQYLATVRPMHERFVAPSRERAALVIDGTAALDEQLERVSAALS